MDLTIIYPIYNLSPNLIQDHLDNWNKYSEEIRKKIYIILIDDGSKIPFTISSPFLLNLTIARITKDIGWNIGGAKNLGFHLSNTQWSLHTDIDHFIIPEVMTELINFNPINNTVYYFKRIRKRNNGSFEERHKHENSYMIETKVFQQLGGFDEDMSGYYGFEDALLSRQIQINNLKKIVLNKPLFEFEKFKTPNCNRDTSRNLKLWHEKLSDKNYKPGPILRFPWEITAVYKYKQVGGVSLV